MLLENKDSGTCVVRHGKAEITWSMRFLEKARTAEANMFNEINSFWASLPETKQKEIFDIYCEIKEVFESAVSDQVVLMQTIRPILKRLYELHPFEDVFDHVFLRCNVLIPEGFINEFSSEEVLVGTRDRTYVREDYRRLVTLAVLLRPVLPVWGEFIAQTHRETGTVWKEYYAFQLLVQTNLYEGFQTGDYSQPLERLRIYIEGLLGREKANTSAILGGISSENYPTWVLALVIVRRIGPGDVSGNPNEPHLVTSAYRYVVQKIKGTDGQFMGTVSPKIVPDGGEGENNLSKLEGYKARQEIPEGDISVIEHYVKNYSMEAAKRIAPDIPESLVRESLASVQALATEEIQDVQLTLAQWVTADVIPPRGIYYISKSCVLTMLGITQAVLWHWGFPELAAVATAKTIQSSEELAMFGVETRARIPREMVEKLDLLYPFIRKSRKAERLKQKNHAVQAIEEMETLVSHHDWRLTLPRAWINEVNPNEAGVQSMRFAVPQDIKIKLAELVIEIAERRKYSNDNSRN